MSNMRIRSATAYLPGTDPHSGAVQARALAAPALSDVASVSGSQDVQAADSADGPAVASPFQEPAAPGPSAAELQQPQAQLEIQPVCVPALPNQGNAGSSHNPLPTNDTGQGGGGT